MPILSLIVETILNIITGNFFALLIITIFIILFDFLLRLFAKNDNLVKSFDKIILSGKASAIFKMFCIAPKVVSVAGLVGFSAFWNYMSYSTETATLILMINIVVNIFTIRSCVQLYRYELDTYNNTKRNIEHEGKMIQPKEKKILKTDLSVEDDGKTSNYNLQEKVTFTEGWKDFWKNYFNFKGKTRLKMFLWGAGIYLVFKIVLNIFYVESVTINHSAYFDAFTAIIVICSIIVKIPLIALNVRRLRDIGIKNTVNYVLNVFFVLIGGVPLVGNLYEIVIFILLCMPTGKFNGNSNKEG